MAINYNSGRRIQGLSYTASNPTTSGFAQTWGKDPSNSQFEVSGGKINFLDNTSSTGDRTWIDLQSIIGSAVSTTQWVLRFKFNFSTLTTGSHFYEFDAGLSDTTVNNMTSQNYIGVRVLPNESRDLWRPRTCDGSTNPRSGGTDYTQEYATGVDYYAEIKRTSASNWSISLSTTNAYDGDLQDNSYTDAVGATGLRYFKFGDAVTNSGSGFTMQGVCDVFEFYNGVTSVSATASGDAKPINVQVGSRFEETDTRKMYHYNEQTPLIDESFASTPAMTWETNGGSSNMVYTVDTTTNNRAEQVSTGGTASYTHGACIGDIGQTLSNNWIIRFNLVHTGWAAGEGGNQQMAFWVSSKKQQTAGNADHAGLFWHTVQSSGGSGDGSGGAITGTYSGMYAFVCNEESTPAPTSVHNGAERIGTGVSNPVNDQNRFIELVKNGNTLTLNEYGTDSTYGTVVDTMDIVDGDKNMKSSGSFNQSQMSAITGLRYIHLGLRGSDSGGGTYTVYCNMIKIWDNVTTVPTGNVWSEEGT